MQNISGDWDAVLIEDWYGGLAAGSLGWTEAVVGTGCAIASSTANAAKFVAAKLNGGRMQFLGTGAASVATQDLLGCQISLAGGVNGLGCVLDFRVAYDTAISTVAQTSRTFVGICDGAGAVLTGLCLGVECGGDATGNWRAAYGNWSAPTYVALGPVGGLGGGVPLPAVVGVPQNIRIIINQAATEARIIVNNQLGAILNNNGQAGVQVVLPAIVAGFPAIRSTTTVGTATTSNLLVDAFSLRTIGRSQT